MIFGRCLMYLAVATGPIDVDIRLLLQVYHRALFAEVFVFLCGTFFFVELRLTGAATATALEEDEVEEVLESEGERTGLEVLSWSSSDPKESFLVEEKNSFLKSFLCDIIKSQSDKKHIKTKSNVVAIPYIATTFVSLFCII